MTTTTETTNSVIRCGNRRVHGTGSHHHDTKAQVRLCFSREGGMESLEEAARGDQWLADAATATADIPANPMADLMARIQCDKASDTCEHGMSADLCSGPSHYPLDDPTAYEPSTSELMSVTSSQYHARGENCPWDCSRCPGNIAANSDFEDWASEERTVARALGNEPVKRLDHPLYDGIYTVESAETEGGYRTMRLRTQAKDDKFAPGNQVISYLAGPNNDRDYVGFGFVDQNAMGYFVRPWKRFKDNASLLRDAETLVKDPDDALAAAECFRCRRTLTVPASINQGYGSECIKLVSR